MHKPNYPRKWRSSLWWSFLSPWEASLNAAILVILGIIGTVYFAVPPSTPTTKPDWSFSIWIDLVLILYFLSTLASVWKDGYRRRFDPELALKYVDIIFKDHKTEREKATKRLILFLEGADSDFEKMAEVDDVLDDLDDIGFLVQGHQISSWVAYQYFSYWVQLYYEAAEEYIASIRKDSPSIWEHIPQLYGEMMEIEAHKATVNKETPDPKTLKLSKKDLLDLLRKELV